MADGIAMETEVILSFLLPGDLPLLCPLLARADDRRGEASYWLPLPRQVE